MQPFKVGLEIHQQLEGKKLFCHCPTIIRDDPSHFTIKRKLRAAAGEEGKIDIAALEEQEKNKQFIYEGYHDTTCLVETDCEPPHEINTNALKTALQFSAIVHASISPIIQVMRKTVVDGSNTAGFQRTALIARNGSLNADKGTIAIESITVEEDACRIIAETPNEKIYRLDRLGIPLIEIATAPEITSPQQCQEVAKKIGLLLRSLSGVKRGLGTIRQDVNISIPGGKRIEIKGAQDLRTLPLLVELEVKRQQELLNVRDMLQKTTLNPFAIHDVTLLFSKSSSAIISKTIQKGGKIVALKLNHFSGIFKKELQPNVRFGTECSARAKVLAGVGGIFHSDELPNYGITPQDVDAIIQELHCTAKDAFVLVADEENKARKALQAVYQRVQEALEGIPQEVRKANTDGTTTFMRSMPGAARLYPETDVSIIKPDSKNITIPELLEDKIIRYQEKLGLSKDLAEFVAKSERMSLFEELVAEHSAVKPGFIAETVTSTLVEVRRRYNEDTDKITDDNFRELFLLLSQDKIHKDIVLDVLIDMAKGTFSNDYYLGLSTEDLHKTLLEIVKKNKEAPFSALMGIAMKTLGKRASGKTISEELQMILREGHK